MSEASELDLQSGLFDHGVQEDSDGLDEETGVVDSKMKLPVSSPELTGVKDEDPNRVDVEGDTSGKDNFGDPPSEAFGMEIRVVEVKFPLTVRSVGVELEDNEPRAESLVVDRTEDGDAESMSPEVFAVRLCLLKLLLPVAVLCVNLEFGGANCIPQVVILDTTGDEDTVGPLPEVFGTRLCVPRTLLLAMVEFVSVELEDAEAISGSVELAVAEDPDARSVTRRHHCARRWEGLNAYLYRNVVEHNQGVVVCKQLIV